MVNHSTQDILKAAQESYLNGDFQNSLKIIRENKDTFDSGLFHYNLGSIYLKLNEFGPARFHLEKAKNEGFNYPMLWSNLKYIKLQPGITDPALSRNWKEVGIAEMMDIPLALYLTFFLVILLGLVISIRKKWLNNKIVIFFIFLISLVPMTFRYTYKEGHSFAVAIKDLRIHEGPSSIYPDYGKISAGSRVIVGRFYDDWYYIISPQDQSGWVQKTNLGFY
jgi:tetratricopeptide (TPR) repeat protein